VPSSLPSLLSMPPGCAQVLPWPGMHGRFLCWATFTLQVPALSGFLPPQQAQLCSPGFPGHVSTVALPGCVRVAAGSVWLTLQ